MGDITRKQWKEFKDAGFLLIVNQILHIFGWAIVFEYNDTKALVDVYPARVKYRGFTESSTEKAYLNITRYMVDHSEELLNEVLE